MENKETQLKVMEALQEEAYKGIVRIDTDTMKKMGVRPGDIIEIEGNRVTVGVVDRAYPSDVGQSIIRMDGILRRNAKTGIGEIVKIRKADVKEAKTITVAPAQQGIMIQAHPDVFKRGLLGRAVLKGDIISLGGTRRRRRTLSGSPFFGDIFSDVFNDFEENFVGGFGLGSLKFIVAETNPKNTPIIITEDTEIKVSPKAIEITEEIIPDVTYEDIGGLSEEIKKIREMVEIPLRHPEIFKRLGVEPPAGVLLHGPPGCGKTLLAKAVANESEANFILVNAPNIMDKFYGESERKVKEIFEEAEKNAPSIIFIDEIDAIASKREETYGELEKRVVSQLLAMMDGLKSRGKVIVIAASVIGDTPILVKNKESIRLVPISEFVDRYYDKDENNIEKPINEVYTLGFDILQTRTKQPFFGKPVFKKIRGVFRHKVNEIYEVKFRGGTIKTTGNHSVFIRTRNGVLAKPVSELKVGEVLVDIPFITQTTSRSYEFPQIFNKELVVHEIPQIQRIYNEVVNSKIPIPIAATQLGMHTSTLHRWANGTISKPKQLMNSYHNSLPEKIKVTPYLMRLFGYYVAEGYSRKELDFCFGGHETNLINDLIKIIEIIFHIKPNVIKLKSNRANIIYNIAPLARFFAKYCGKGAYNKHVPEFLFEAPREYFLEFLKGYIAGDGYISKDGAIEITSVSKQIITELNWLCRMHGIKSYIASFVAKAGRRIRDQEIKKATKAYRLGISKHNNPFDPKNTKVYAKRPRIKSIKKIPYNGYVYDLCGCDNEAFFGGTTPILLHNTNRPNAIDPALRRPGRFDRELQIGVPDKKGRLNILKIHTRNMPLHEDVNLKEIAEITHGFVGADVAALAKEAAMNVLRRLLPEMKLREKEPIPKDLLDKLIVTKEDFKAALRIVRPSAMREVLVETPNVKWEDIGGLENVKQELIEAVEWPLKYPSSFKQLGIRPPRGILLYGPPGVGKTLIGKAVANESESNFILVRGPELIDKWVGSSEKGIRKIFEKARQTSPTIIFFDEIDSIAPRRGLEIGVKVTERIVNTLLSEMDGIEELSEVIVIASTNRPDLMDPALLRPGRFDRTILVTIPDEKTRLEIFKIHTSKMPLTKDVNLQTLAKSTINFVGADIANLCREAGILALRDNIKAKEIPMKYFKETLKRVKPSITQEQMEAYKMLEQQYLKAAKSATLKQEIPTYLG